MRWELKPAKAASCFFSVLYWKFEASAKKKADTFLADV